jgi:phosphatidylinositol alpha-1,6-mannosyltransferase
LLAGVVGDFGAEHRLAVRALALGRTGSPLPHTDYFGTSVSRLALAVWRLQLRPHPPALVFDLLGLARTQPWLPRALRSPYLVPLLGIDAWQPIQGARWRGLRDADVRFAISHYTARRAMDAHRLPAMPVIHLALEPSAAITPDVECQQAGPPTILVVGRLAASERYKGHDELLAALPLLIARHPELRLIVVGDGDDRPRLEAKASHLGVAERVTFRGFVDDRQLAALYGSARVFAMPSRGEGFGLVFLEAMRAGLPCIAARDTAAAEVIVDGETGLLVDPDDPAELARALDTLLADRELAARMGLAGRVREATVFTRQRFAAGLAPLLSRLAGVGDATATT